MKVPVLLFVTIRVASYKPLSRKAIISNTETDDYTDYPHERTVQNDLDGVDLPSEFLGCAGAVGRNSFLCFTAGRLMSSFRSEPEPTPTLQHTLEGWVVPRGTCSVSGVHCAAVDDLQGSLIAVADVMQQPSASALIRNVDLPQGMFFAVVGSCVYRLI